MDALVVRKQGVFGILLVLGELTIEAYDCDYVLLELIWRDFTVGFQKFSGHGIDVCGRGMVPVFLSTTRIYLK